MALRAKPNNLKRFFVVSMVPMWDTSLATYFAFIRPYYSFVPDSIVQ